MKKSIIFCLMLFMTLFLTGQEVNTVSISYVMNKSNPPSYTFTSDFKGEALNYYWNFTDMTSSEEAMPTHAFKITGNYGVVVKIIDKSQKVYYGKLEARFEGGSSLTLACQALFTASVSSAPESKGKKVSFLNTSTGEGKEYAWTFGDGKTSTEKNPVHEYTGYGEYKVCLVVSTAGGCKSDHCITLKLNDPAIPVIVPGKGYVKDLSRENCGLVIVLSDGTVLLPVQMVTPVQSQAGQNVEVAYEVLHNTATICQSGQPVKIHKITVIGQNTTCKASFTFANFKTSAGETAPKKIVFTNTSTGNITSSSWSFGDGSVSTDKNPSHEYTAYGEYRVCLVIGTASGCTSEYCTAIKLAAPADPTACKASFTFNNASAGNGVAPKKIAFTNTSAGNITSSKWSFGDGYTNTDKNPVHEYGAYGEYRVCLVIGTASNCTSDYCQTVKVTDPGTPVLVSGKGYVKDLNSLENCGLVIALADGTILLPVQMVPDFALKDGQYVEVVYEVLKNVFTTCQAGKPVKIHKIGEIGKNTTCKASFTFANFKTAAGETAPKKIAFTNTSTGNVTSCKWNFGDGNTSTEKNPVHEYGAYGEYRVCLAIGTASNCTSDYCQTVKIADPATPVLVSGKGYVKDLNSLENCGLVIALDDGAILLPVQIVPDFTLKAGQYVEVVYEVLKNVFTTCMAGKPVKIHKIGEIGKNTTCKASFTFANYKTAAGETAPKKIAFTNTSTGNVTSSKWNFGDGTTSTVKNPVHEYAAYGEYRVCLVIGTASGCTSEYCANVKVTGPGAECQAYFTATNELWSDMAMRKKMVFSNQSTGTLKECTWSFGDGTTGTEVRPVHEYPAYGTYKACLSILTTSGCKSEYCAEIMVTGGTVTPTCNFDLIIKQKDQTNATYLYYAVSNVVIKSWKWNFGDGKTNDGQNPEHTYEKAGTYEVSCTVVTESGCTATRTKKITVPEPVLPVCPGAINLLLYDPAGTITLCNGKAVVKLLNEKGEPYSGVTYSWSNGATGESADMLCPNKLYSVHAVVDKVCQKNTSFAFLTAPAWKVQTSKNVFSFSVETPAEDIVYKWDFGDGNSAFGSSVDYTYKTAGEFNVTLTAISGSYSNESTKKVAVISGMTSVTDDPFAGLKVFPNPVREYLRIVPGNSVSGNLIIEMTDLKGQMVYTRQFSVSNQNMVEVDTRNLMEGIYLLRMKSNNRMFPVIKVIKAL